MPSHVDTSIANIFQLVKNHSYNQIINLPCLEYKPAICDTINIFNIFSKVINNAVHNFCHSLPFPFICIDFKMIELYKIFIQPK